MSHGEEMEDDEYPPQEDEEEAYQEAPKRRFTGFESEILWLLSRQATSTSRAYLHAYEATSGPLNQDTYNYNIVASILFSIIPI